MQIRERVGWFRVRQGAKPRSAGVHLSGVLRFMALEGGILKPSDEEEDLDLLLEKYPDWQRGDRKVFNRIALGLAWEDWYARQQPGDVLYHPGECVVDGIHGTPDAVRVPESLDPEVWEYKLTWKSCNPEKRPIEGEWLWWTQLKSYCRMVGALRGELHVYYVNGDYAGSGPLLKAYRAEFTQEEVDRTWESVVRHRDRAKPEKGQ